MHAVTSFSAFSFLQIFCLSKSLPQLPLQIEDAMRPENQGVRAVTVSSRFGGGGGAYSVWLLGHS